MDTSLDNANNPFANSNGSDNNIIGQKNEGLLLNLSENLENFKHNGDNLSPTGDFYHNSEKSNGKRLASEFDDDDDLGPETDVDAVDDVVSPSIAAAKALAEGIVNNNPDGSFNPFLEKQEVEKAALEIDLDLQKQQSSEFDGQRSPREETPTPPADAVHDGGLEENIGDSGEESEDEWNYIKGEEANKENVKPTSQSDREVADILEEQDNMSQLNPNAAEFVPVSPTRSIPSPALRMMNDPVIAQSPKRPSEIDINLPNPQDFENEVKSRPGDVFRNGHDDEGDQKTSSEMENLLNGKNIDEIPEFQPGTTPSKSGGGGGVDEFHFGPNAAPFTPVKLLDQSEAALSTRAVYGDESAANLDSLDTSRDNVDFTAAVKQKEEDPMSMSFYGGDSDPVDLDKVQMLPENLEDFLSKEEDKENLPREENLLGDDIILNNDERIQTTDLDKVIDDEKELASPVSNDDDESSGVCELAKSPQPQSEDLLPDVCQRPESKSPESPEVDLLSPEPRILESPPENAFQLEPPIRSPELSEDVCQISSNKSPEPPSEEELVCQITKPFEEDMVCQKPTKTPEPVEAVCQIPTKSPEPFEDFCQIPTKSPGPVEDLCQISTKEEVCQIPTKTPEPFEDVCKIPAKSPEPLVDVCQLRTKSPEPLVDVCQIPTKSPEPVTDVCQIPTKSPEPVEDVCQIPTKSPEPVDDVCQIPTKSPEPVEDVCQIPTKSPEPVQDLCQIPTKSPEPVEDVCQFSKSPVQSEPEAVAEEKREVSIESPLEDITSSVKDISSPEPKIDEIELTSSPIREVNLVPELILSTPRSVDAESVATTDVNSFLERSPIAELASPLSPNHEITVTTEIKTENILPEFAEATVLSPIKDDTPSVPSQEDTVKEPEVGIATAAAAVAAVGATAAVAAVAEKKTPKTTTTKTSTTKKPAAKTTAASKPLSSPTKPKTTTSAPKPKPTSTTTTKPSPKPQTITKLAPKPKTTTTTTTTTRGSLDKKPLTNGDVKAPVRSSLTARKSAEATKPKPSPPKPTTTTRPTTAPVKATSTSTKPRPTTLTNRTSTSKTVSSTTTAAKPKTAPVSSPPKPRPTTAPVKARIPLTKPLTKTSTDAEKLNKDSANKLTASRTLSSTTRTAAARSVTSTVRKTETKATGTTRTTVTKTSTTTGRPAAASKKPLTTRTTTTTKTTKIEKPPIQNGVATVVTEQITIVNSSDTLVKDNSPIDNKLIVETNAAD